MLFQGCFIFIFPFNKNVLYSGTIFNIKIKTPFRRFNAVKCQLLSDSRQRGRRRRLLQRAESSSGFVGDKKIVILSHRVLVRIKDRNELCSNCPPLNYGPGTTPFGRWRSFPYFELCEYTSVIKTDWDTLRDTLASVFVWRGRLRVR